MVAPGETVITTPSPASAVLSASAGSSAWNHLAQSLRKQRLVERQRLGRGANGEASFEPARSERSGANEPLMMTSRRKPSAANKLPASCARAFASASGGAASGLASRISAPQIGISPGLDAGMRQPGKEQID